MAALIHHYSTHTHSNAKCQQTASAGASDPIKKLVDGHPSRPLDGRQQLDENEAANTSTVQRQHLPHRGKD